MTSLLITGGTGFIGRNLAQYLGSRYAVAAPSSAELDLCDARRVEDYLDANHFDVIVHAATTRSNRRHPASSDLLNLNCRMFFNLARNQDKFGKLIHFGSGAEYERTGLPAPVRESYFDTQVPSDPYGFSKYICAKYIERARNLVDLRLFGVFGKYEDATVRFISNACCRVIAGLPIVMRQNVEFDYLYVDDLAEITAWFVDHDASHRAYNVCTGRTNSLLDLAAMVKEVSGKNPEICVRQGGLGPEYSGDNSRLLTTMGGYDFRDVRSAVAELYDWYRDHTELFDIESLRFDEQSR
ncbi:MAG: NAD(P)-dependent oxidoreductase [Terriglobales bacterium]